MHDGDKLYANLKARQPFPLSAPQIIILEDRSGEELMTIPDLEQLDETSKEVLKKGVRANNFTLKINSIKKVVVKGDELEWYVTADAGQTVVQVLREGET